MQERAPDRLGHLTALFAELSDEIAGGAKPGLEAIARVAVARIDGAEWASVTLLRNGRFSTAVATDDRARAVDRLQYELGSGPCVDAVVDRAVYAPRDLRHDDRWPEFGRRAHDKAGVLSMLAYRLHIDTEGVLGGLNLYATELDAFSERDQMVGLLLATHAAGTMDADLQRARAEDLQQGLRSNREIGTAMGVLMARHKITRAAAFDLLRVVSQHQNRKLHDVALDVVETGDVPERFGGVGPG